MLFGLNEEDEVTLYIGEVEEVYNRLQNHLWEKDFWNEVIVFISKYENLNKAHIKYLKNKLYHKAKEAIDINLPMPSIPEADRAEINNFGKNVEMLANMLGDKLFSEVQKNIDTDNEKFYT